MKWDATIVGGDLVLRDPDGRRHFAGRVKGTDGRTPSAREIANEVDAWMADNGHLLRGKPGEPGKPGDPGKPGRDATAPTPMQVADALFEEVRSRVSAALRADLREPIRADLEDALLPKLEDSLQKPVAAALAPRLKAPVVDSLRPAVLAELSQDAKAASEAATLAWLKEHASQLKGEPGQPGQDGKKGDTGDTGPAPEHEWRGNALRFRNADGSWGKWRDLSPDRRDQSLGGAYGGSMGPPQSPQNGPTLVSASFAPDGRLLLVLSDNTTIDAGVPVMQFDDYAGPPEYLEDQQSTGPVLNFEFADPVQQVWIEMTGSDTDVGRATTDGSTPTASRGIRLHANQAQPVTDTTSTVLVLAPAGSVVTVYGLRRA